MIVGIAVANSCAPSAKPIGCFAFFTFRPHGKLMAEQAL
jgi:hypothetical protein